MDFVSGKDGWLVGGSVLNCLFVFGTLINVLLCDFSCLVIIKLFFCFVFLKLTGFFSIFVETRF